MYRGRDFAPTREFEYGVSGKNRSACELWLAFSHGKRLFALASLLYYRHNFEIVDNVATISSIFAGFQFGFEKRGPEGTVYQGKFVAKGDGVRWVLKAGTGKNGKLA